MGTENDKGMNRPIPWLQNRGGDGGDYLQPNAGILRKDAQQLRLKSLLVFGCQ